MKAQRKSVQTARLHFRKTREENRSVFVLFCLLLSLFEPPSPLRPLIPPEKDSFGYTWTSLSILPPSPPAPTHSSSAPLCLISGRGALSQQGAAGSRWAERQGATWESVACGGGGNGGGACGGLWATRGAAKPAGGWAARRPRRNRNLTRRKGSEGSWPSTPGRGRCWRWSRTLTPAAWRTWWWRRGSWAGWPACF